MMAGYVTQVNDVEPVTEPGDTVSTRTTIDRSVGAERLVQRVLTFSTGVSRARQSNGRDEVAYVVSGMGTLVLDGEPHDLYPDVGVYIRAGETYEAQNPSYTALVYAPL